MIAAVDHTQKCVWGWGANRQEAHQDALAVRAEKQPGITWTQLDYCELKPDADLDHGGFEAYKHIAPASQDEQPAQAQLF